MVRRNFLVIGTAILLSLNWIWHETMIIAQKENAGGLILIDEAHSPLSTIGMNPSLYDEGRGKYSEFARTVQEMGYTVSTLNPGEIFTASKLQDVRCLVIVFSYGAYTQDELLVIQQWVLTGGKVLLILDYMLNDNVKKLADLFGASVGSGEPQDALGDPIHHVGNLTSWMILNRMNPHPITKGVTEIEVYAATSIIASEAIVLMRTGDDTIWTKSAGSMPNAPVMVLIKKGLGEVVMIGDHNLWDDRDSDKDGTINLNERDNKKLLQNTIRYLASGGKEESARETPPVQDVAVAVAVGAGASAGIAALMSFTGVGGVVNSAISRFSIPGWLKDLLMFYGEESFKALTPAEVEAHKKREGLLSGKQLIAIAISSTMLFLIYAYVEANGYPNILDIGNLIAVLPSVLMTVVFVFLFNSFFCSVIAALLDVWGETKIWLYGLVTFLLTGIIFLAPFASPSRTEYEGEMDEKRAASIAMLKIIGTLILCVPFYLLYKMGYTVIGDAGLLITTMTACFSSIPTKPLEGEEVFKYNKIIWFAVFVSSLGTYIGTLLRLFPLELYLISGVISTLVSAVLIAFAKGPVRLSSPPLPPPPPE